MSVDGDYMVSLGEVLRGYRGESGLTQRQLAGLSGMSERAIRDLECGRATSPRRESIRLLANAMKLRIEERVVLETAAHGSPPDWKLRSIIETDALRPPVPVDPMIGRRTEFEGLVRLFVDENRRLVRIVGIGGVGKTRMAQEVASHLHQHQRMSVIWIGSPEPAGTAGSPSGASALVHTRVRELLSGGGERLRQLIGGRGVLVVVDDQDEAKIPLAQLRQALRSAPTLRVLTTSRTLVPAVAEPPYVLLPLPVPGRELDRDPAALAQVPSVQLLMAGLRQVRPETELDAETAPAAARICRALDGLPAALVLGARWGALLDPQTLAKQLEEDPMILTDTPGGDCGDFPRVLDSLRAAGTALSPSQSRLLTAVAALPGDWSIQDAAALAGLPGAEAARDVYAMLIRGLLRRVDLPGHSRFEILHLARLMLARRLAFADC